MTSDVRQEIIVILQITSAICLKNNLTSTVGLTNDLLFQRDKTFKIDGTAKEQTTCKTTIMHDYLSSANTNNGSTNVNDISFV